MLNPHTVDKIEQLRQFLDPAIIHHGNADVSSWHKCTESRKRILSNALEQPLFRLKQLGFASGNLDFPLPRRHPTDTRLPMTSRQPDTQGNVESNSVTQRNCGPAVFPSD